MKSILRIVLSLALLCAITSGILAYARAITMDKIQVQQLTFIQGPILDVVLQGAMNNPIEDRFTLSYNQKEISFFPATFADGKKAVAFETFGMGFGSEVGVMVAVDITTNAILGIDITTHSETPGLGSQAKTNSGFKKQFAHYKITDSFRSKSNNGNIDVITGATITSNAVCAAVDEASRRYQKLAPEINAHFK